MTLVSRTIRRTVGDGSQDGDITAGPVWTHNLNGTEFIVGEPNWYGRFMLDIPRLATITSAALWFEYTQKDPALAQTATIRVDVHDVDNEPRWPRITNTTYSEWGNSYFSSATSTINYPGGSTPGADLHSVDITTLLQEVVNRPGWEVGNHVGLRVFCTAESANMSMTHTDQPFAGLIPELRVTYTYDDELPDVDDVNRLLPQTMEPSSGPSDSDATHAVWSNAAFGYWPAAGVAWQLSTVASRTGLRVYTTADVPVEDRNKPFGVITGQPLVSEGETWVFTGRFYNPSASVGNFRVEFLFQGGTAVHFTQRDSWTYFTTEPFTVPSGVDILTCAVGLSDGTGSAAPGQQFWVDDLTFVQSRAKELPFNQGNANRVGRVYKAKEFSNYGVSVRRGSRQFYTLENGVAKPRRRFVRDSSGMMVWADTREPSLPVEGLTSLGNVILTPGVSFMGRTWTRVEPQVAGHGVRAYVPLDRLVQNQAYAASWLVTNDQPETARVSADWVDLAYTAIVSVPTDYQRRLITSPTHRPEGYDDTYRFTDLVGHDVGVPFLVAPNEVRVVKA